MAHRLHREGVEIPDGQAHQAEQGNRPHHVGREFDPSGQDAGPQQHHHDHGQNGLYRQGDTDQITHAQTYNQTGVRDRGRARTQCNHAEPDVKGFTTAEILLKHLLG